MTDIKPQQFSKEISLVKRSKYKNTIDTFDSYAPQIKYAFLSASNGGSTVQLVQISKIIKELNVLMPLDLVEIFDFFSKDNKIIEKYISSE